MKYGAVRKFSLKKIFFVFVAFIFRCGLNSVFYFYIAEFHIKRQKQQPLYARIIL